MTPSVGIEDHTGSGDLFFPGARQPLSTSPATSPARPAAKASSIFAQGDTYLVSLSYTGKKTTTHRRRSGTSMRSKR